MENGRTKHNDQVKTDWEMKLKLKLIKDLKEARRGYEAD